MQPISSLSLLLGAVSLVFAGPSPIEARATKSSSATLPTITTKGNAFWAGNDRFYIRGIDYQPGGSSNVTDPLADYTTCSRDIPYFKQLGLNTIRVYTVDNSANHDECMSALADAGIYLALDVNTPKYSINRADPGTSYNPTYLQSLFATIDAFSGYSNTLLFFSGNEVINDANSTPAAPYVKAVTRDMKQYINQRGYRSIPVGYSAADVSENQYLMAQYMDCGDTASVSDFYAINNYEWCDPSSYTTSGWSALVAQYSNYSLPLFMSEYGCITNTRTFAETSELYKPEMTKVFSGGLVYEYSLEGNGYGVVSISGNTVSPVASQFSDLKSALADVEDPSDGGGYTTSSTPQNCPDQSDNWSTTPFTASALPAFPSGAEALMKNGAGSGPGLTGAGSQEAGDGSATASASSGGASPTTSASSSETSKSAADALRTGRLEVAPAVCGSVLVLSMLFGAALV